MYAASNKLFWFPFYILIVYVLFRSFGKQCWQPLLFIALLIIASDQISAHLIKNAVMRLRPSHEIALIPLIHLSKAGPGGLYGFISSHAANTTSLTVFLVLLLNKRLLPLKIILISWALLVSYSRIYNGVHYPSDVLVAIVIGSLLGLLFYLMHQFIFSKAFNHAG
jgi:undecaprenyl-diphosphatase